MPKKKILCEICKVYILISLKSFLSILGFMNHNYLLLNSIENIVLVYLHYNCECFIFSSVHWLICGNAPHIINTHQTY